MKVNNRNREAGSLAALKAECASLAAKGRRVETAEAQLASNWPEQRQQKLGRELVFPGDDRRLMDMRRSGVVEAIGDMTSSVLVFAQPRSWAAVTTTSVWWPVNPR
jgi:hypothetical protein